jgi:hypothetical protein
MLIALSIEAQAFSVAEKLSPCGSANLSFRVKTAAEQFRSMP